MGNLWIIYGNSCFSLFLQSYIIFILISEVNYANYDNFFTKN